MPGAAGASVGCSASGAVHMPSSGCARRPAAHNACQRGGLAQCAVISIPLWSEGRGCDRSTLGYGVRCLTVSCSCSVRSEGSAPPASWSPTASASASRTAEAALPRHDDGGCARPGAAGRWHPAVDSAPPLSERWRAPSPTASGAAARRKGQAASEPQHQADLHGHVQVEQPGKRMRLQAGEPRAGGAAPGAQGGGGQTRCETMATGSGRRWPRLRSRRP